MMANIPRISISEFNLTIQVDPDHQQQVQGQMEHALAIFPNMLTNRKKRGLYKSRYALTTPNGQVINIEANPAREGYNYLKLSYSPANLSQDETELLANYLNEILGPSYREDFYGGRLQRIEVSFVLQGMLLDDLWIYRTGERDKKVALICNADMDLQLICIGHKSTRQWVFTQEARESADAVPSIRVEYRYDKGNYLLKELHQKLDDPLNPITIRRYSEIPDLDDTQTRLLFDALRLRGKKRVLELYSDDEQESIQAAINRFPMIDESKLRLALWSQLRGEIEALLPDSGDAVL